MNYHWPMIMPWFDNMEFPKSPSLHRWGRRALPSRIWQGRLWKTLWPTVMENFTIQSMLTKVWVCCSKMHGIQLKCSQLHDLEVTDFVNQIFVWLVHLVGLILKLLDFLHSFLGFQHGQISNSELGLRKREAVLEGTIASLTSQLNSQSNCNLVAAKRVHSLKLT